MTTLTSFFKVAGTIAVIILAAKQTQSQKQNYQTVIDKLEERIYQIKNAVRIAGKNDNTSYSVFVSPCLQKAKENIAQFEITQEQFYLQKAMEQVSKAEKNCSFFLNINV